MSKKNLLKHTVSYHDEFIESLKDAKEALAYLSVALEEYQQDNNVEALLIALRNVTLAKGGIAGLAKETKLNRQSLYKILSPDGNPKLDTLGIILNALGFRLSLKYIG